jgi:hypothetical protein
MIIELGKVTEETTKAQSGAEGSPGKLFSN